MLEEEINGDSVPTKEIQEESIETKTESEESENKTESQENEFSNKSRQTDLTLVVEDRQLYVNKGVIAIVSPVFEAMLYGDFKENQYDVIPLPGKKYDDFVKFLRCFHPQISRQISRVTGDNIYEVLPLAHEYQVQHLVDACEETFIKLLSGNPSESSIYKIMEQACRYELSKLRDKCIEIGAELPVENLENACTKFKITKELENAVKDKFLKNLRTKYKDVFGHVKTSRALFRYLGLVAKEQKLVERYMEGEVTGDHKHFEMSFDKLSHEMHIGEVTIEIYLHAYYNNAVQIRLKPKEQSALSGFFYIKIHNWMAGKDDKSHEISSGWLHYDGSQYSHSLTTSKSRTQFEDVTNGFIHDGKLSVDVFIFCY